MSSLGKSLLVLVIAIGLSGSAFAQPKADAGSGPTSGAASPNDAGSGPTKGAKPNTDATAASNPEGSTENSAGVTRDQSRPEARSQLRQQRPKRSSNFDYGPHHDRAMRMGNH